MTFGYGSYSLGEDWDIQADDCHTSVCRSGWRQTWVRRHWPGRSLEGLGRRLDWNELRKKGDNYVLPLLLHVPLEGTCLLLYLETAVCTVWPVLLKLLWEGLEGWRTGRISCKRCNRTSPGLGRVLGSELSFRGAVEHEGREMHWDAWEAAGGKGLELTCSA